MARSNKLFKMIEQHVTENIIELAAKEFETHFITFKNVDSALSTVTRDLSLSDTQIDEVKALLAEKGYKF